jgi:hypothetical protein
VIIITIRTTITLQDELQTAINEFNSKHPYEKLNISAIAQKAIFDKIMSIDPHVFHIPIHSQVIESKTLVIENGNPADLIQKECAYCKNQFTAINPVAKFCSDKCKSADYRMRKKENKSK